MKTRRVLVLGAGPSGSAAALSLRRRHPRAEIVLLDAAVFPRDKICAGGLSVKAQGVLSRLGVLDEVMRRANPINQLMLVGPGGEQWLLRRARSVVLPRRAFDALMVRAAVEAGAVLREGVRARGLLRERGRVVGAETSEGVIEADVTVIATGVKASGLKTAASSHNASLAPSAATPRSLLAVERRFEGWAFTPSTMEMIYAKELLPGYGWVFPESSTRANVGIAVDERRLAADGLHRMLQRFLDEHLSERLREAKAVDAVRGQPIAWRASVPSLFEPGALWVGEAAALTSAATGEGIWHALASGVAAAEAISASFDAGEPKQLASYQRRCVRALGPALGAAAAFSRLASSPLFSLATRAAGQGLGGALATKALERL